MNRIFTKLLVAGVAAVMLQACMTFQPTTDPQSVGVSSPIVVHTKSGQRIEMQRYRWTKDKAGNIVGQGIDHGKRQRTFDGTIPAGNITGIDVECFDGAKTFGLLVVAGVSVYLISVIEMPDYQGSADAAAKGAAELLVELDLFGGKL